MTHFITDYHTAHYCNGALAPKVLLCCLVSVHCAAVLAPHAAGVRPSRPLHIRGLLSIAGRRRIGRQGGAQGGAAAGHAAHGPPAGATISLINGLLSMHATT